MPDRSTSARVTTSAPEPISNGEFHTDCGKFCAQVTQLARKLLCLKRFFGFEQECSKLDKPVAMSGLAWASPNCNSFNGSWLLRAEFDTISTVRQIARADR